MRLSRGRGSGCLRISDFLGKRFEAKQRGCFAFFIVHRFSQIFCELRVGLRGFLLFKTFHFRGEEMAFAYGRGFRLGICNAPKCLKFSISGFADDGDAELVGAGEEFLFF